MDYIEKRKDEYLEPVAKKAIDKCAKAKCRLVMMIDGFRTDKEALNLRSLLWYARNKGVEVRFVPKEVV